jgi:hypothetical protein
VQAYTSNYVRLNGGDGDDLIQVGTHRQDVGAVQVDGGAGADVITLSRIAGGRGGLGYADGGAGADRIQVGEIWGNSVFHLRGGAGDDRFEIAGSAVATRNDHTARVDGGAGFDSLVWNGSYNLTVGGRQNPAVGLLGGFAQQVQLSNIERLDLASAGASGLRLRFEATDVAAITAGSDFQRSTLGFGLSGAGGVLFVDAGANQFDLGGWSELGWAMVNGANYQLHQSGTSILGLLGGDPTPSGSSGADVAAMTSFDGFVV